MNTIKSFESELYALNTGDFNDFAVHLFRHQALNNSVYKEYIQHLGVDTAGVNTVEAIPFLPVTLFKTHDIKTGLWKEEKVYTSSATTGLSVSRHLVKSDAFYLENTVKIFEWFFGPISNFHFLALLPSYLERSGSSLIAMVEYFIQRSGSSQSGFFLHNEVELIEQISSLRGDTRQVVLVGVTFALLDLAEKFDVDLSHCMVMETGGMKGRRPEITRAEVHRKLTQRFHLPKVYSEYGMTELFSQAYSTGEGLFQCPPWMKVILRDPEDPLDYSFSRQAGAINIIDLANVSTCSFIETQDLGKLNHSGYFEVLGRMDNSDIRGCNLLAGS